MVQVSGSASRGERWEVRGEEMKREEAGTQSKRERRVRGCMAELESEYSRRYIRGGDCC